jgi:signal transduction histidine kinase
VNGSLATILIISTARSETERFQKLLEASRYRVLAAKDSKKALAAVIKHRPAVVLVTAYEADSVEQSIQLCQLIKSDPLTAESFIVVVGQEQPETSTQFFDVGVEDVLLAPISEVLLVKKINALVRVKLQLEATLKKNQQLADELARRNEEAERTLRESREVLILKDTIVRNVSHELRTPMLQIKSSVAMLAEDARAASPNGQSSLADHATAATAKLESVVQNITQLAASLNVKLEPFQLSDAVNSVTRQLARQWASAGGVERIVTQVHDIPPLTGDRGGVTQVLRQLIDNGLKFSPNGGPVEIIAERNDSHVCIAVRDHGIGIPQDQMDRIFQAFYQVDSTSTRPFGGTGVGLAIVKLLLDAMGTKISVESKIGEGSTFSFLLPIAVL